MATRRAPEVIQAEADLLKEMKPRIRRWSAFNDDNWAMLDAQIAVLDDDLDEAEINQFYDNEDVNAAAYTALRWRNGEDLDDGLSVSDGWKDLVK